MYRLEIVREKEEKERRLRFRMDKEDEEKLEDYMLTIAPAA